MPEPAPAPPPPACGNPSSPCSSSPVRKPHRLLDEVAHDLVMEGRSDYLMAKEDAPGTPDSITRADAIAAAGDLRQAADQFLDGLDARLLDLGQAVEEVEQRARR